MNITRSHERMLSVSTNSTIRAEITRMLFWIILPRAQSSAFTQDFTTKIKVKQGGVAYRLTVTMLKVIMLLEQHALWCFILLIQQ